MSAGAVLKPIVAWTTWKLQDPKVQVGVLAYMNIPPARKILHIIVVETFRWKFTMTKRVTKEVLWPQISRAGRFAGSQAKRAAVTAAASPLTVPLVIAVGAAAGYVATSDTHHGAPINTEGSGFGGVGPGYYEEKGGDPMAEFRGGIAGAAVQLFEWTIQPPSNWFD